MSDRDGVHVVDVPRYLALEVTRGTFDEISAKLTAAGYSHFCGPDVIDCFGVALMAEPPRPTPKSGDTVAASPGRDSNGDLAR